MDPAPDTLPPSHPLGLVHRRWIQELCAPDPAEVAEEARWLAEPPVAAIATDAWHGGPGVGLVVTASSMETCDGALIRRWLSGVESSRPLPVPSLLRHTLGSACALAVPMRTPTWTVGALALPWRPGWGPIARELEALGTDFALRFEAADRRAQLRLLRAASVGPRPTDRRHQVSASVLPRERPGPIAVSRVRSWEPCAVPGRRPESRSGVLSRDGALASGRR